MKKGGDRLKAKAKNRGHNEKKRLGQKKKEKDLRRRAQFID